MRPILVQLYLCLVLLQPLLARAEPVLLAKDPLSYPLKQYALMLGVSILGGLVSWFARVRSGEAKASNLMQLIGELCTSAFAGLLAFWACEWMSFSPLLEAAVVGMAGHMGTRGIASGEQLLQAWLQSRVKQ